MVYSGDLSRGKINEEHIGDYFTWQWCCSKGDMCCVLGV